MLFQSFLNSGYSRCVFFQIQKNEGNFEPISFSGWVWVAESVCLELLPPSQLTSAPTQLGNQISTGFSSAPIPINSLPSNQNLLPHELILNGVFWLEVGEEEAVFLCSLAAWRLSRAWSCSQRSLGTWSGSVHRRWQPGGGADLTIYPPPTVAQVQTFQIIEGRHSAIWLGMMSYIDGIDERKQRPFWALLMTSTQSHLSPTYVTFLCIQTKIVWLLWKRNITLWSVLTWAMHRRQLHTNSIDIFIVYGRMVHNGITISQS